MLKLRIFRLKFSAIISVLLSIPESVIAFQSSLLPLFLLMGFDLRELCYPILKLTSVTLTFGISTHSSNLSKGCCVQQKKGFPKANSLLFSCLLSGTDHLKTIRLGYLGFPQIPVLKILILAYFEVLLDEIFIIKRTILYDWVLGKYKVGTHIIACNSQVCRRLM